MFPHFYKHFVLLLPEYREEGEEWWCLERTRGLAHQCAAQNQAQRKPAQCIQQWLVEDYRHHKFNGLAQWQICVHPSVFLSVSNLLFKFAICCCTVDDNQNLKHALSSYVLKAQESYILIDKKCNLLKDLCVDIVVKDWNTTSIKDAKSVSLYHFNRS